MTLQKACDVADLPEPGGLIGLEVDQEPVAIVRTDDGELFAINDICSHAYVKLSDGGNDALDGCEVECFLHAARFNVRTGQPLSLPATDRIDTYPIEVDGDDVLVDVSAPLNAPTS